MENNHSKQTLKPKVLVLGASWEVEIFYRLLLDENLAVLSFDRATALSEEIKPHPDLTCHHIDFSQLDKVNTILAQEHLDYSIAVPVGRALTALGRINDTFKLNGPSFHAIDTLTDKHKLHLHLNAHHLNDHDFICLPDEAIKADESSCDLPLSLRQLHSIINTIEERFKYPLIIKPCYGSGSLGVSVIENRDDLLSYRLPERFKDDPVLVEQYIYATEYLVNAFIDADGVCHSLGIYQKEMTLKPYRQELAYLSDDYAEDFKLIKPCIEELGKSLNLINSYVQADIFVNRQDGKVNIVDFSPRLTGNSIIDMQLTNKINPIAVFKRCVVDKQPFVEFAKQEPACMHFYDFRDCPEGSTYAHDDATSNAFLDAIFTPEERSHIALIRNHLKKGDPLKAMTCGSDCARGHIITTGENLEQATELAKRYVRALASQA